MTGCAASAAVIALGLLISDPIFRTMCGRVRLSSDVSENQADPLDPDASTDPELPADLERRAD